MKIRHRKAGSEIHVKSERLPYISCFSENAVDLRFIGVKNGGMELYL